MRRVHAAAATLALVAAACGGGARPPADAGVDQPAACVPASVTEQVCDDTRDDDCDSYVDCEDVDCASSPSCEVACVPAAEASVGACTNGVDDDCDGAVDCADDSCIAPGLFACVGAAWSSRCVSPLTGSQTLVTTDAELLLTSSGVSGTVAHPASGMTMDIVTVGATPSATFVSLVAPPNDNRDTCTHCFVLYRGAKTYFVRSADVQLDMLPSALGEPFSAVLRGSFEEVLIVDNRVQPVPGGECLVLLWTVTGTAVATTDALGLAGTGFLATTAAASRFGQTSGIPECDGAQTLENGAEECACSTAALVRCPGGHACPTGSTCLTQGRCECHEDRSALGCDSGAVCGAGSASCDAGSAWGCLRLGCGIQNYTTDCGDGFFCPTNSTCEGGVCVCAPGYEMIPCEAPEGYGMCTRTLLPGCPPSQFGCGGEGILCPVGSTCSTTQLGCDCPAGTVAVSCDGIRCSSENPCWAERWFCAADDSIP